MDRLTAIRNLNDMLLAEMPEYRLQAGSFPPDDAAQRRLLRSLMNVRPPMPLRRDFLALQDALLSEEREARGAVEADSLPVTAGNPRLALWRGGHHPPPGGRRRGRGQLRFAWLLLPLPRLRRQRHPLGGGPPAPG